MTDYRQAGTLAVAVCAAAASMSPALAAGVQLVPHRAVYAVALDEASDRSGINDMVVERDGAEIALTITPERLEIEDRFGNQIEQGIIGVVNNPELGRYRVETYGPVEAVGLGFQETWYVIARTGGYLAGVVTGRENADQIGGPIRVAQVSGQVATLGFVALLNLTAILSVSIGLLNLLPVPILDGGHLLFYAYEAVRGRPLSETAQEYGYRIGFALVLGLMVFATWNDITILFGSG